MDRKKTFYITKTSEIEFCGEKLIHVEGGEFEFPFQVKSTKTKHSLENCKDCQETHKLLISEFAERAKKFPKCCKNHSKLFEIPEFVVGNYQEVPKWAADKIMFSYHHFMEWIDHDSWYREITDYFEYCIESYGSFPYQYGEPFLLGSYSSCLLFRIESIRKELESDTISKRELDSRVDRIVNYLESLSNAKLQKNRDKNFNLLLEKYNTWFKLFPFDLEYFKPLKRTFQKRIPVFRNIKRNKYLGTTKMELHSIEDFTEILINTTKDILAKINALSLYEKGELSNTEKLKLDLILQKRKLEVKELSLKSTKTERGYVRILKEWLKGEKEFVKEIKPYLKDVKRTEPNEKLTINQIALKLFYEGEIISKENCNDIINEYGHKSGDKLYQRFTYYSSTANRKANPHPLTQKRFQNKIELFKSVIGLLSEEGKERALDELNILKDNYKIEFE